MIRAWTRVVLPDPEGPQKARLLPVCSKSFDGFQLLAIPWRYPEAALEVAQAGDTEKTRYTKQIRDIGLYGNRLRIDREFGLWNIYA